MWPVGICERGALIELHFFGMGCESGGTCHPMQSDTGTDSEQVPRGNGEKNFGKRGKQCM